MDMLKVVMPVVVAQVVVLVLLVVVIRRIILAHTTRAIEQVRQVESEVRKKEEGLRRQIEEHERELAQKKQEAETQLQRQKEEAEREVGRLREQITADARRQGEQILEQAKRNEASLRQQLAQEAEEKAVDYAGQAFQLVVSEKLSATINEAFIDELLDALEQVDSTSLTVEGDQAQFVTSHPLTPAQRERLARVINEKFGVALTVVETVKPEVLGGMMFKLGSMEIDGTMRARIQEAIGEVKKSTRA